MCSVEKKERKEEKKTIIPNLGESYFFFLSLFDLVFVASSLIVRRSEQGVLSNSPAHADFLMVLINPKCLW